MPDQAKLTYDFFHIGQEFPVYVHTLREEEIDDFCNSFKEKNPVYIDDVAAKRAGFSGRIAPPTMVRKCAHIQNALKGYGKPVPAHSIHVLGEYYFLFSVRPDDTITTVGKVIDKYIKKGRKYISFELISKNQREETVVINRHTSIWPK